MNARAAFAMITSFALIAIVSRFHQADNSQPFQRAKLSPVGSPTPGCRW
jgi:hypothetical protein